MHATVIRSIEINAVNTAACVYTLLLSVLLHYYRYIHYEQPLRSKVKPSVCSQYRDE